MGHVAGKRSSHSGCWAGKGSGKAVSPPAPATELRAWWEPIHHAQLSRIGELYFLTKFHSTHHSSALKPWVSFGEESIGATTGKCGHVCFQSPTGRRHHKCPPNIEGPGRWAHWSSSWDVVHWALSIWGLSSLVVGNARTTRLSSTSGLTLSPLS